MPNIKPIDAGVIGFRPSDMGVEATAATGRRIGAFYNQAAQAIQTTGAKLGAAAGGAIREAGEAVDQYETHAEVSAGAAHAAQMLSNLLDSKDEVVKNLDSNDPNYGAMVEAGLKGWRETVLDTSLEKFREGFTTRKSQAWAEHFIDTTREHMFHQTTSDMSEAAGVSIHNNMRTMMNTASNNLLQHPETLDTYLGEPGKMGLLESAWRSVVESSPLRGVRAAKVMTEGLEKDREQLTKFAVKGAISKASDPEAVAQGYINKYPQYIKGDEALELARAAKSQKHTNLIEQKQLEIAGRQETDHAVAGAINDIYSNNVKVDNQGNYDIRPGTVRQLFDLHNKFRDMSKEAQAEVSSRINWIESKQREKKEAARSDQAVVGDFLRRVDADVNPLRQSEIWQAEAEHKITPQDGAIFRGWQTSTAQSKELKPDRDKFLGRMQPSIDPGKAGGLPTAFGQAQMQKFEMDLRRKEKELGVEARSLYDPTSQNYFGKTENIFKYRVTMQQAREYDKQLATGKPPEPTEPTKPEEVRSLRPIPQRAIDMLKNNPSARDDFNAKYGKGQAEKILGK